MRHLNRAPVCKRGGLGALRLGDEALPEQASVTAEREVRECEGRLRLSDLRLRRGVGLTGRCRVLLRADGKCGKPRPSGRGRIAHPEGP